MELHFIGRDPTDSADIYYSSIRDPKKIPGPSSEFIKIVRSLKGFDSLTELDLGLLAALWRRNLLR